MATQKDLERRILEESTYRHTNRETKQEQNGQAHRTKWGSSTIRQLIEPLSLGLQAWITEANSRPGRLHESVPYAAALEADKAAWLALTATISGLMRSRSQTAVALKIGTSINNEVIFEQVASDKPFAFRRLTETATEATRRNPKISKTGDMMRSVRRMNLMPEGGEWSADVRLKVGLLMLELIIRHTGIVELTKPPGDRSTLQVVPSQLFLEFIDRVKGRLDLLKPVHQPMIELPLDWTGMWGGGYHTAEMQYPLVKAKWNMKGADQTLSQTVLDSANVHQRTAWRVNTRVLEVLKACLELGVSVPGIPPLEPIPIPPRPQTKGPELSIWKLRARDIWMENNEAKCTRAALAGLTCLAEQYAEYPSIWFPVQLDFRGRGYYVPSGLNPQGTDAAKGLLDFAEGVPLGPYGFLMLLIRAANTYGNGVDKLSYMERIYWCLESEDSLLASGRDPIGQAFWRKAKKPFQFIRVCLELYALAAATGATLSAVSATVLPAMSSMGTTLGTTKESLRTQVSTFVSHCAFRIDASCSGIQHFSALTLDPMSAGLVNIRLLTATQETTCRGPHTCTSATKESMPQSTESGCAGQTVSSTGDSSQCMALESATSSPSSGGGETHGPSSEDSFAAMLAQTSRPMDAYQSVADSLLRRLITLETTLDAAIRQYPEESQPQTCTSSDPSGCCDPQGAPADAASPIAQSQSPKEESRCSTPTSGTTEIASLIRERQMCRSWINFGIADRDLTKRQTMVLTYGSTFKACMDYTTAAVTEIAKKRQVPIPGGDRRIQYIAFLSKHLWAVMHEVISGPMKCMDWLRACSDILSKGGKPVQWTAPNGFKCVQKYLSVSSRRVSLMTGDKVIKVSVREPTNKLDARKSANSAVPNCIHSFDAAYKDFLAIEMANREWAFGSNHDEFCCPMGGGADLFYLTRDQMAKIYATDWLQILYQDFCSQASDPSKIPLPPPVGTLDVNDIRGAYYMCS